MNNDSTSCHSGDRKFRGTWAPVLVNSNVKKYEHFDGMAHCSESRNNGNSRIAPSIRERQQILFDERGAPRPNVSITEQSCNQESSTTYFETRPPPVPPGNDCSFQKVNPNSCQLMKDQDCDSQQEKNQLFLEQQQQQLYHQQQMQQEQERQHFQQQQFQQNQQQFLELQAQQDQFRFQLEQQRQQQQLQHNQQQLMQLQAQQNQIRFLQQQQRMIQNELQNRHDSSSFMQAQYPPSVPTAMYDFRCINPQMMVHHQPNAFVFPSAPPAIAVVPPPPPLPPPPVVGVIHTDLGDDSALPVMYQYPY